MSSELVLMPQVSVQDALHRYQAQKDFIEQVLKEGVDYGEAYPGSTKKTLLKPGAEKLAFLFGLFPTFVIVKSIENWGDDGTEPLFYYWIKCTLNRGENKVAEGEGSCSSWETRYRYRTADYVCPVCEKSGTIIKGKEEYGGGWLCYAKKGGCGAKFNDGDEKIESQPRGTVLNKQIYDQVNTILKIAEKRALIAATLIATNSSEYFTQDIEDFVEGTFENVGATLKEKTRITEPAKLNKKPSEDKPANPPEKTIVKKPAILPKETTKGEPEYIDPVDPKHGWTQEIAEKIVEKGYATNNFNAYAILRHCPLDSNAQVGLVLGWVKHYRNARDIEEMDVDDAASYATEKLAEYLESTENTEE